MMTSPSFSEKGAGLDPSPSSQPMVQPMVHPMAPVVPVVYEESYETLDSHIRLYLHHAMPQGSPPRAHVLIIHGYMEHGGRYKELAGYWAKEKISSCAPDMRGHGKSDGPRGYIEAFSDYLRDVDALVRLCKPSFILGHSAGGLIALDYVDRLGPGLTHLKGVMVTNPFLALTHPVTGLKKIFIQLAGRYMPSLNLPSPLDPCGLSHDPHVVQAYQDDPLVFKTINARWMHEITQAQQRVQSLHAIDRPLLYVFSQADPIASPQANAALAHQLASETTTCVIQPHHFHEVLNETDRYTLYAQLVDWIHAQALA